MEGWRPGKEIVGQPGEQEEQEKGANGETKGKNERAYAGVENEEGRRAYRIQMRQRIE